MYDLITDRVAWKRQFTLLSSAAAADLLDATVPPGELWRIITACAYHDDPAAHDVYWALYTGGTMYAMESGINLATSAKYPLYTGMKCWESLILPYGFRLRIQSTAAMAAGKKLYMHLMMEKLVGVVDP